MKGDVASIWAASFDRKQPIAVQLHRFVRSLILTLKLVPNEMLSEKELSAQFGVSRTPVREALIKLSEEGLVDILPQRGSFVAPIRIAEVLEAQFIRESLEISVIRRVAATSTQSLNDQLDEALRQQRAAIERLDFDMFLQLDEDFHKMFCDFCELPRGWRVVQNVKGQLDRVRYLSLPEPGHLTALLKQHGQVVEAIKRHDPELAAAKLRLHLQGVFSTVELLMQQNPSLFGPVGKMNKGT